MSLFKIVKLFKVRSKYCCCYYHIWLRWRAIEKTFILPEDISCFPRCLQDYSSGVFNITISHRPRRLQHVFKASSRRIWKKPSKDVFKAFSRQSLEDVLKRSSRRRLANMPWRRIENVLKTSLEDKKNVALKTSSISIHQDK